MKNTIVKVIKIAVLGFVFGAVFIASATHARAAKKVIGTYSPDELSQIRVCTSKNFESITLISKKTTCSGRLKISSVALTYDTGFQQFFDYPAGSELSTTSLRVLPGTKCLTGFSADVSSTSDNSCASIEVIVGS